MAPRNINTTNATAINTTTAGVDPINTVCYSSTHEGEIQRKAREERYVRNNMYNTKPGV